MNTKKFIFLGVMCCAFTISSSASLAGDAVCGNLKSVLSEQQKTYIHYQHVNREARDTIKNATNSFAANQKLIKKERHVLSTLTDQLIREQSHLSYTQKRLALQEQRIKLASEKPTVPLEVMANEQQLIAILHNKYRNMCVMRNADDPAQTELASHFYP